MKKKLLFSLFIIALCFACCVNVFASENKQRLVDNANLLTEKQSNSISQKLDEISAKYDIDVVILTVHTIGSKSARAYADDYYDYNGYSDDGVLLLIAFEEGEWYISTTGKCIKAFTDSDIDYIGDLIVDDLADENYFDAFETFISESNYEINGEINGFPFEFAKNLVISLIIGFVIALISVSVMKGKLKSVKLQKSANSYLKQGSMKLTESTDLFLYRNVNRIAKPQNNNSRGGSSTHRSSSGRSHGGGGGRFR